MEANGVLTKFHGIAVHDCWKSYWNYNITHAVCCAHLLRELTGIEENYAGQIWATKFKKLLLEMKRIKEKAAQAGKSVLSYYHLHKFSINYDNGENLQSLYIEKELKTKIQYDEFFGANVILVSGYRKEVSKELYVKLNDVFENKTVNSFS